MKFSSFPLLLAGLCLPLSSLACAPGAPLEESGQEESSTASLRVLPMQELEKAVLPQGDEKLVLMNIWATWCVPCIQEMPALVKANEQWKSKGVRIQTLSVDPQIPKGPAQTPDEVLAFMQKKGWDLPVICLAEQDPTALSQRFRVKGFPTTLILAPDGEVLESHTGKATLKRFNKMIERHL